MLQPLTVALISLVLVSLALVTGLMDLRTLDKTLTGYIEERGLDIIKNVQQAARYNFHLLGHESSEDMEGLARSGLAEEAFSLRESLMLALLGLAQRIDLDRDQGVLDDARLTSLAAEEGLSLVGLLDPQGRITYRNRPIPERLLGRAAGVIRGDERIVADFFDPRDMGHLLVVRRKQGQGAILFALNPQDFEFWRARVSIQRAVEEVQFGTDHRYFMVTDTGGRILYQTGEPPASPQSSDRSLGQEKGTLDLTAALQINGAPAFRASLGLSREAADLMLEKERQQGWVFIGFMVSIAIVSMGILYRSQARHLARMREMEKRLHRAERLSAMGRLAAGVAHEIRNPLNAMSMACQRLQQDNLEPLSRVIRDEIRRLNRIVEDFVGFSRSGDPVLKEGDIVAVVRQIGLLMEREASSRGIDLRLDLSESPLTIRMDADKVRQALLNIVKNAMESIPAQGRIALSVRQEGGRWIVVRISDTGIGLTPSQAERIFEPDFTTKEKGLGLGLALAHEIIGGHGGEIRVKSEPGRGTTFEVVLPIGAEG